MNRSSRISVFLSAVLLAISASRADAQVMSHDMHDSASKEPVLGVIDFPTEANAASHKAFIRGVLLMHNFHYPRAVEAFQEAQRLDPTDVMGYWGEAMAYSHPVWNQQNFAAAQKALLRLGPTREARLAKAKSPREREWLESAEILYGPSGTKAQRDTAWSRALKKMHETDPNDLEATTFYALSLLGLNQGDREAVAYQQAYELVLPVFQSHPQHPGAAHYLIHATDDPDHAALGLQAAEAYASIAPSAAHAIHMTSHIFLALGKWDEMVSANRRARGSGPVLGGHVSIWLHYGLIQQGRYREADVLLDSMIKQTITGPEARRLETWDAAGLMAASNMADTKRWTGIASTLHADYLEKNPVDTPEGAMDLAAIEFGYGLGALNRGDTSALFGAIFTMAGRRAIHSKDPLMKNAAGMSEVMEKTLQGYGMVKSRNWASALALFRSAAEQEAKLPMPFGPPMTIKPPREAAGELLLSMRRPAEALIEFKLALDRTPRRTQALIGLARAEWMLGNRTLARRVYQDLMGIWHLADTEFPELTEARVRSRVTLVRGGGHTIVEGASGN